MLARPSATLTPAPHATRFFRADQAGSAGTPPDSPAPPFLSRGIWRARVVHLDCCRCIILRGVEGPLLRPALTATGHLEKPRPRREEGDSHRGPPVFFSPPPHVTGPKRGLTSPGFEVVLLPAGWTHAYSCGGSPTTRRLTTATRRAASPSATGASHPTLRVENPLRRDERSNCSA
jgi:hypothetical protein